MKQLQELLDEIKLLVQYAAPEEFRKEAYALVEKHGTDSIALNIFHAFYSYLPEAEDDRIRILRLLNHKEGTFLICASTELNDYLYLATTEGATFLGNLAEGIWEDEVLSFFGYDDRESFIKECKDLDMFSVYVPAHLNMALCPFCLVEDGEFHVLGCPVEICPWCKSQLTTCACRFGKLGRDKLGVEKHLNELLDELNKKGRVPFDAEKHRPDYPLTPEDLKSQD